MFTDELQLDELERTMKLLIDENKSVEAQLSMQKKQNDQVNRVLSQSRNELNEITQINKDQEKILLEG